jgi:transmembrane sensor
MAHIRKVLRGSYLSVKWAGFFNVSHDPEPPFVVKAADGYIRVTGTRFNVWKYEDSVRVTLLEGSVLVSSHSAQPNDGVRLDPGMQANFKAGDYSPVIKPCIARH